MKTRSITLTLFAVALAASACATSSPNEDTTNVESSIRVMTAEEKIGQVGYGETLDVDLTTSPKYRAVSFQGQRNDQVQVTVVSRDATDPVMWLTDAEFNNLAVGTDASATNPSATATKFLPKTGTYWIVFREMNAAPRAKFSVTVRKIGALPAECDLDGEGFSDPACTEPMDSDPFNGTSCDGANLTTAAAKVKFAPTAGATAFRLTDAKIYYRTRQCAVNGATTECTPWARTWLVDTKLTTLAAGQDGTWAMTGDTTRAKVKIQFDTSDANPAALKSFCVDGPFSNLRGTSWAPHTDQTPGGCTNQATVKVTAACARFEPPTIQLNSGSDTYYTEFGSVLLANY